jgi:thymidylate synthase
MNKSETENVLENLEEQTYLNLMRSVLRDGCDKPTRTGTDARSITGAQLRFNLFDVNDIEAGLPRMILPLLTTKNTSFRLILTELLWFLEGECNATALATVYNNHIWDANSSREYLDKIGKQSYQVGQLGPIYGVQWRHWNRDLFNPGIDQIAQVIQSIKLDPYGRRHVVSAWNVEQIPDMALAPCHILFQFIVRPRTTGAPFWLDCVLTQRSADLPLGVPFNIASYAILTHMIASLTGLHGGVLVVNLGDCHIYHNQFDGCKTQLERTPRQFPELRFKRPITDIDDFHVDDFELVDYKPHPTIKFPFSV